MIHTRDKAWHFSFPGRGVCIRAGPNLQSSRRLTTSSSYLEFKIFNLSVEYVHVPPYDKAGCTISDPNTDIAGGNVDRFNIIIDLSVLNTGVENFNPPTSFVGTAACGKAAIYDFYQLVFPGGPYYRYAACLTDDSYYSLALQSSAPTCSQDLLKAGIKPSNIGGGYGLTRRVTVKFPMNEQQYSVLNSVSPDTTITVELSVNQFISAGSTKVLTFKLADKLTNIAWKEDAIYHPAIPLYTHAAFTPTAAPIPSSCVLVL
jgi:hypothetical protein